MNDKQLEQTLMDAVEVYQEGTEDADNIARMTSFEDGGVLTNNAGFTVTLEDGSEYQVTIVRSR